MAFEFELIGDDLEITFKYRAEREKVENVITNGAHYLYDLQADDESPPFDDLTNQQRGNIMNDHIRLVLTQLARTYVSIAAQQAAKEEAEAGFDDDHELSAVAPAKANK